MTFSMVPPDQEQRNIILSELGRNILVEAGAGTGKTTCMVGRMVALLKSESCEGIDKIAAITFTRKAAAELKSRFRAALERGFIDAEEDKREIFSESLENFERCFIGTIHSFCAKLIRERPVEAGTGLDFNELEDSENQKLLDEAWNIFMLSLVEDGVNYKELEETGLPLDYFKDAFQRYAEYPDINIWPTSVTALKDSDIKFAESTFRSYLDEIEELEKNLPRNTGNDRLIPKFRELLRLKSYCGEINSLEKIIDFMKIFDSSATVVQSVWSKEDKFTGQDAKDCKEKWDNFRESTVIPFLNKIYVYRYPSVMKLLDDGRRIYDSLKEEKKVLNFQDLLLKASALLRDNAHIRKYFKRKYSHILVDEFQDTDPIQAEMLMYLTADNLEEKNWKKCNPRAGSLFVVGDPKQSIYRFRRADIVTYNEVRKIIENSGEENCKGKILHLSANFRTTASIIDWVNSVFEPPEKDSQIKTVSSFPHKADDFSPAYVPLGKGRTGDIIGELSGLYRLSVSDKMRTSQAVAYDADRIARVIKHCCQAKITITRSSKDIESGKMQCADYADFMIVTRNRKYLSVYAEKLKEYGIPHIVTGGTALNDSSELKLIYLCLRAITDREESLSLFYLLRSELFGFSDRELYRFRESGGIFNVATDIPENLTERDRIKFEKAFSLLGKYRRLGARLPAQAVVKIIVSDLGIDAVSAARDSGGVQTGCIVKALSLVDKAELPYVSIGTIADYFERLISVEEEHDGFSISDETEPKVRVMNLHKVKGLESPVVFLAGPEKESIHPVSFYVDRRGDVSQGYMEIFRKVSEYSSEILAKPDVWEEKARIEEKFNVAEELRLKYVAATRAGSALIITCRKDNNWECFEPFLDGMPEVFDPSVGTEETDDINSLSITELERDLSVLDKSKEEIREKTFATLPVRSYVETLKYSEKSFCLLNKTTSIEEGENHSGGADFGKAVHSLLEQAMKKGKDFMESIVQNVLKECEVDLSLSNNILNHVKRAMKSELWERAVKSRSHFTEVPFQLIEEGDIPLIVKGVIDLVFKEKNGWVIVDYKTDVVKENQKISEKYLKQVDYYRKAWEKITGEKVLEAHLYFTSSDEAVKVEPF